jgi:hypothetical protein
MIRLRYLTVDLSDNDEGITTIEALASTSAAQHAAALAEAQQVLDWAWRTFPHTHGPADDGGQWDHDLQVGLEGDGWHAVTLTLTGTPEFAAEFSAAFGDNSD